MTTIPLNYEEREAIKVIRKSMQRKPEIAAVIMQGMSKEAAVKVLLQARDELNDLMQMSRAFSEAARVLTKLDEPKEPTC
jgi:hypothetical protein